MRKPRVILTFTENGQNGGPYTSHKRILFSSLSDEYEFVHLDIPRFRRLIRLNVAKSIISRIKETDAEILHFSGLGLEGFCVQVLAMIAGGVKTVCGIRGSASEAKDISGLFKKGMYLLEKYTLKKADICYANSRYVAGWDIIRDNARNFWGVIYNLPLNDTNRDLLKEQSISQKKRLGIPKENIVVFSAGRITKDKGYDILAEIITARKWLGVSFIVAGNGKFLPEMKELIKNDPNDNQVEFLGYIDSISEILCFSDVFISCSKHETFGNAVAEAQWFGVPVVASKTGGIPEIVDHNKTGILVPVDDITGFIEAVESLLIDNNKRKQMSGCASKHIREILNEKGITDQLDNLYKSMLV